jgi:hypothetical protein
MSVVEICWKDFSRSDLSRRGEVNVLYCWFIAGLQLCKPASHNLMSS